MASSDVLTLRLAASTNKRLARLARATNRTRSRIAADAIEQYLEHQAWQVEAIEEGVQAAEAGEVVSQEEVEQWVESWIKEPPRKRRRR